MKMKPNKANATARTSVKLSSPTPSRNIISEEGEANEKQQQDDTREIREEAFVERSREENLSREEVKNEESIDDEEERGKEETTVFVDVNTAADVPRKGCQSVARTKAKKKRVTARRDFAHSKRWLSIHEACVVG